MVKLVFHQPLVSQGTVYYGKHIPKIWQHFVIPLGLTPLPGMQIMATKGLGWNCQT